MCSNSSSIICD